MANSKHDYTRTPGGKIKRPMLENMCKWILNAWRSITFDDSEDDACFANRFDNTANEIQSEHEISDYNDDDL